MTERQVIKVKIIDRSVYGSLIDENNYGADSIVDLIAWLQGILDEVLVTALTVYFDEGAVPAFYGHHVEMSLSYQRDETDSEMEKRVASDATRAEAAANRRLADDRAAYERLKAKFEGTGQ